MPNHLAIAPSMHYRNRAIWRSWNLDIPRSLYVVTSICIPIPISLGIGPHSTFYRTTQLFYCVDGLSASSYITGISYARCNPSKLCEDLVTQRAARMEQFLCVFRMYVSLYECLLMAALWKRAGHYLFVMLLWSPSLVKLRKSSRGTTPFSLPSLPLTCSPSGLRLLRRFSGPGRRSQVRLS